VMHKLLCKPFGMIVEVLTAPGVIFGSGDD
jgi:hypothetical protein